MIDAPPDLLALVRAFDEAESALLNETQVREQFINRFFHSLGWNVTDPHGPPDVVLEDKVAIKQRSDAEAAKKAPDYGFYLGSNRVADRKFFVEAKRPSVSVATSRTAAYQLRRYAWSAGLPLSILTDFEEFAVYDCTQEPDPNDSAATALEFFCRYDEYESNWEYIASTFSRDAVAAGSLDRLMRKPKRGSVTVDQAFLRDIARWRLILAMDILEGNAGLSDAVLNYVVQLTIDRLIFLRIAEDRNIEDYGRLREATRSKKVYKALLKLFDEADRKYNSGLFHFRRADKAHSGAPDDITPRLKISDEALTKVIKGLYWPRPYAFNVIPAHILGAVYEQFLGDVLSVKDGKCSVEQKPEVRKAGGVFYTPEYVVQHIVERTVGRHVGRSLAKARRVRVLDPACGSGSFLIGAYQYLLDWHLDYYTNHNPEPRSKGKDAVLYRNQNGTWSLRISERKRILLSSIYGVDLDPQAVEVAKLSLLLKLLENETDEMRQKRLFVERVLPDLGNNILCGNSLVEHDYFEDGELGFVDPENRVNAFEWSEGFPELMEDGFDAVIGNPPYVRIQRIDKKTSEYLYSRYQSPTSKMDLSIVFIERALRDFVSEKGSVGFICTGQWMYADYGRKMREMLSDGQLHEVVDFGSLPVFRDAQTYPAIFLLGRQLARKVEVQRIRDESRLSLQGIKTAPTNAVPLSDFGSTPWLLGGFNLPRHLAERELPYVSLSDIGKAYIGAKSGKNEVFVLTPERAEELGLEMELLYPYAKKGGDVLPFGQLRPAHLLLYPYVRGDRGQPTIMAEETLRKKYPNAHAYLRENRALLRDRKDSRRFYARGADWFRLLRAGTFSLIDAPKIVVKGIEKRPFVGFLPGGTAFDGARCPAILIDDLKGHDFRYFVGLLNSRPVAAYLNRTCPPKLNDYVEYSARGLGRAPLRLLDMSVAADRKLHDEIVELVDALTTLMEQFRSAQLPNLRSRLIGRIRVARERLEDAADRVYGIELEHQVQLAEEVPPPVW